MERRAPDPGGSDTATVGGRLVIFDLDRTLIHDSSLATVARVALRHRLISPWRALGGLVRNARYARHGEHGDIASWARDVVLGTIAGKSVDDLLAVVDESVELLVPRVRPSMVVALDAHLEAGDRCVVLSASPHELVDALARRLGAERGVGTEGEIVDGRCTGRLDGPFCHGVGKLERLRAELGAVDLSGATVYTDSSSDLPLLDAAGHRVVVDPDDQLRERAERDGWTITS
jgi:HAD superfamily hydrolase (TIGR01490 family)